MTIQAINLISIDPEVRGGRPCIADTSVEVAAIAINHIIHRQSPDEIAADYQLSLAQVYAALAYYYDHKPEVDANIQDRRKLAQEMKDKQVGSRHSAVS